MLFNNSPTLFLMSLEWNLFLNDICLNATTISVLRQVFGKLKKVKTNLKLILFHNMFNTLSKNSSVCRLQVHLLRSI